MTKQKTNSKFTKAASLAASLALVLNGGVKFASAYDEQSIVCEHKTASISCPTGELISVVDGLVRLFVHLTLSLSLLLRVLILYFHS